VESTAKLSAFVVFILIGARVFSLTFYGVDGHKWVEELLVNLPGGQIGFLVFVNAFVFVLAFFLDFFEIAFIVIPLLALPAQRLGIDLIWFGVMLGVNMQTSFLHPPFGFALFYLRSVCPNGALCRSCVRQAHGAGDDRTDLLGRGSVRVDSMHHWSARHRVPGHWSCTTSLLQAKSIRPRSRSRSTCPRRWSSSNDPFKLFTPVRTMKLS